MFKLFSVVFGSVGLCCGLLGFVSLFYVVFGLLGKFVFWIFSDCFDVVSVFFKKEFSVVVKLVQVAFWVFQFI